MNSLKTKKPENGPTLDPRNERYTRYSGIIQPSKLIASDILIVGVGAVGRQVALQLAAMGVGKMSLIDFDKVEELNLGPQGYKPSDVGKHKVYATADDIKAISPGCKVRVSTSKLKVGNASLSLFDAVFSCVDCMATRKEIFFPDTNPEAITGVPPKLGIDTRMSAFTVQTMLVNDETRAEYARTLFTNEQAHQEPCTARSTIFTASIAAGLAINHWVQAMNARPAIHFQQLLLDCGVLEPMVLLGDQEASEPAGTAQPEHETESEALQGSQTQ